LYAHVEEIVCELRGWFAAGKAPAQRGARLVDELPDTHTSSPFAWGRIIVMLIGSVLLVGSLVLAAVPEGPNEVLPPRPPRLQPKPSEAKPWVLKGWKDAGVMLSETGAWNGLPSGRFATQEECQEELHTKASPIYTKLTQQAKTNPQLTVTVNSQPNAVSWTVAQASGFSRSTSEYHMVCYLEQN